MATWTGLEPVTSAVTGRRSNQLSYQAGWPYRGSGPGPDRVPGTVYALMWPRAAQAWSQYWTPTSRGSDSSIGRRISCSTSSRNASAHGYSDAHVRSTPSAHSTSLPPASSGAGLPVRALDAGLVVIPGLLRQGRAREPQGPGRAVSVTERCRWAGRRRHTGSVLRISRSWATRSIVATAVMQSVGRVPASDAACIRTRASAGWETDCARSASVRGNPPPRACATMITVRPDAGSGKLPALDLWRVPA